MLCRWAGLGAQPLTGGTDIINSGHHQDPGSADHAQAATRYRAQAQALAGHQGQLPAARQAAASARQALKTDDEHRQIHGPQVMTGELAHAQLMTRVRDRLDTAVADSALLPEATGLPRGPTDPESH